MGETDDTSYSAIRRNIEAVVKLEEDLQRGRTRADRLADAIASFTGSLEFVALHAAVFGAWIAINLGWVPGIPRFDPYPFMLLSAVVSLEAIFLSTFVLVKQNRMSRREDLRAHLDLQINLLAEREMTAVLQMVQRISDRLGVQPPSEVIQELAEETSVEAVAEQLQKNLPEE
ncbi:MAG: hypothetical protein C5B56_07275 [Proteobacteria bacterium]|nr:MAG: hypothetical protein C5B56_07275 [Pseudomonadota bacterium]